LWSINLKLNTKMNQKSNPETPSQNINLIGPGTKITGDISCDGDIRIDGSLKGNIKTKGRLVIGNSGNIEGEIVCSNIEISGNFKGKISASELLTMKSTAVVTGDIMVSKLGVEPGSVFSGTCRMGNTADKVSNETAR
jgi:cytoskeletal protein CcmA (bactofilin family)